MRRRRGEGIAWHGTVPPQKWMNFSTKVLSRFAATPGLKLEVSFEVPPGDAATEAKREETKAALRELRLAEDLGPRERIPVVRDVTQPPCPAPEMPLVPKVFGSVEPPGLPPPCSTLPFPGGMIGNAVLFFSNPTRLSQS